MRIADSKYGLLLTLPGLIFILALVLFPLGMLFVTSFLQFTPILPIKFDGIKNYEYIFGDRLFWLSLPKTVIYAGGATGLTFCGGLIIALLLSKITRGSGVFRSLTMFTWAVPLVISGFIWRWIFNPNVGIFSDLLMKLSLISEPIPIFSNPVLGVFSTVDI